MSTSRKPAASFHKHIRVLCAKRVRHALDRFADNFETPDDGVLQVDVRPETLDIDAVHIGDDAIS